jgi:VIT1/CCC1 family predicted Fe2+/Mn2+ transporter
MRDGKKNMEKKSMNEYFQIIVAGLCTGLGTGLGAALGAYAANKALIQNLEKLVSAIKSNGEKELEGKNQTVQQEKV